MKIAVISNIYPPHYLGGYEVLCEQISHRLNASGHKISVLTSDHKNPNVQSDGDHSFLVERTLKLYIPFTKPAKLMRHKRFVTSKYNYKITQKFLHKEKPDIAFIWSQLRSTLGAAYAAQDYKIPCVYTFNDENISSFVPAHFSWNPKQMIRFMLDHYIYPEITLKNLNLNLTTSISEQVKKNLLAAHVPIPESNVIYQGISMEQFPVKKDIGSIDTPLSILYVGQLHHYKGVHTIMEALSILRDGDFPTFTLTIVGDGSEAYKDILREKSKNFNTTFLGKVPHSELSRIYQNHNIFIFPSIWQEPFGLTHLEAMASGTIVVSTNDGGHGEFLNHMENAFVFEKNNPSSLAQKLKECVNNPKKSKEIAICALRIVRESFTLDAYANNLESFLKQCL